MLKTFIRSCAISVILAAAFSFQGCKPRLLPNTSVKDTPTNASVVNFISHYSDTLESRSVTAIMGLVAKDFFETKANQNSRDDYGYKQLKVKLEKTFANLKDLKVDFYIQHIVQFDDRFDVVYYFYERALIESPTGDKWLNTSDVNKMQIRKKGNSFEIVSGI